MEKKTMGKEVRRWCTGLTISEIKKEIRTMEEGKRAPKKCYLCKRPEGDKSVVLTPDAKEPYALSKIALHTVERKVGGLVYDYLVCLECGLLVGLTAKTIGQKKRTQ